MWALKTTPCFENVGQFYCPVTSDSYTNGLNPSLMAAWCIFVRELCTSEQMCVVQQADATKTAMTTINVSGEEKCVLSPSWLEKAPGVYLTTTYSRNDCTYILLKSCKQKIEINKSDLSVFVWRIWRIQPHKTTMFITVYSQIFLNIYFLFMLLNAGHTIRCKKQLKIKEYIWSAHRRDWQLKRTLDVKILTILGCRRTKAAVLEMVG